MAPLDSSSDRQNRIARCRKWADLARADTAGARLAALALEIEQTSQRAREIAAVAEEKRRHVDTLYAEIVGLVTRIRQDFFFMKQSMRGHYGADDLREESRLCREEALASEDDQVRRNFAGRAAELAMMGEATARNDMAPEGQSG